MSGQGFGLEILSAMFHKIYQDEMRRQGRPSVHAESYSDLPEQVKDLDRALARFVLDRDRAIEAAALREAADACEPASLVTEIDDPEIHTFDRAIKETVLALITSDRQLALDRMLEEARRETKKKISAITQPKVPEFLNWIADRLVSVYGESPNIDFVHALRRIAHAISAPEPPAEEEK